MSIHSVAMDGTKVLVQLGSYNWVVAVDGGSCSEREALLLSFALQHGMHIHQMDVKGQGKLWDSLRVQRTLVSLSEWAIRS